MLFISCGTTNRNTRISHSNLTRSDVTINGRGLDLELEFIEDEDGRIIPLNYIGFMEKIVSEYQSLPASYDNPIIVQFYFQRLDILGIDENNLRIFFYLGEQGKLISSELNGEILNFPIDEHIQLEKSIEDGVQFSVEEIPHDVANIVSYLKDQSNSDIDLSIMNISLFLTYSLKYKFIRNLYSHNIKFGESLFKKIYFFFLEDIVGSEVDISEEKTEIIFDKYDQFTGGYCLGKDIRKWKRGRKR